VDEFIDELLREERVLDIQLPRLQKRNVLEENNQLEPRQSVLDEDIDDNESSDESDDEKEKKTKKKEIISEKPKKKWQDLDKPERSPSPRYARSQSPRDKSSKKRK
jgi:pre-mRNA-splicing factor 38A